MTWKACNLVEQRTLFVEAVNRGDATFSELCREWSVSRVTGYKWLARFRLLGRDGLEELSRRPETSPNATVLEIQKRIIAARRQHPFWGARKLVHILKREHPTVCWPAASTTEDILRRAGLVKARIRRRGTPPYAMPFVGCVNPNDVWCADFKGQFQLDVPSGPYCYPLTVTDGASRFIFECRALPGIDEMPMLKTFKRLFEEFGLPGAIRTDNGTPFASTLSYCGLNRFSVWLIRLGIRPERIDLGKPQQNGRHERMHKTLKEETPIRSSMQGQQKALDAFREEFNTVRPHEALGMATPASIYKPSERRMPMKLPQLDYPSWNTVLKVDRSGSINLGSRAFFLGAVLAGQYIGLEPIENGSSLVRFGEYELGTLNPRWRHLRPAHLKRTAHERVS